MISNVMIIDDSPIDRKIIRQIIEKRLTGINIFEAENGINLNERLVENDIHMCILDIMMPAKNGFEVLEDMKLDSSIKDIPVIVCTGIDDNQAIEKALTLGAYDYFSKPLSKETMKTALPLKIKNAVNFMKRNEEVRFLSYHDSLTGLYNRRYYEEAIKNIDIPENLPISIIMGDINGLKLVNDTFGHDKGDELLKKASSIIKNSCRSEDIVARWGGDEFIILLPKTSMDEAESLVSMIKDQYTKEHVAVIDLSVSFGCDTMYSIEENIAKVLKSAEDRMYRCKTLENVSVRSNMINAIINTLHEKNPREEKHSIRVSEISQEIGKAIGLPDIEIRQLKVGGLLHDIGKIAVEEVILNKPGKLSQEEWEEIKRHPEIGYRILGSSNETLELVDCVLSHHEKWDGTGYPKGLKGEEIPKVARIIAVADSYDAMVSDRPYRKALTEEAALEEIRKNSGIQFDPEIASIFVDRMSRKQ